MSSYDIVNPFSSSIAEKDYLSAYIKTTEKPYNSFPDVFSKENYTASEYRLFFFKFATEGMFVEKALQDILFGLYDDIYANTGIELETNQIDAIGDPIICKCYYCKKLFIFREGSYYCGKNCYTICNFSNPYPTIDICNFFNPYHTIDNYLVTSYIRPIKRISLDWIEPVIDTIIWSELHIEDEKPKHQMNYKTYFRKDKILSKKFNNVRQKFLKTNHQKRKAY
jgi:hypothetical protein